MYHAMYLLYIYIIFRSHGCYESISLKKLLSFFEFYNGDKLMAEETPRMDANIATAGTPCQLGNSPAKFLEIFDDWWEHHSLLADTIGIIEDRKLKVLLLWGGKDFRKFAKDANIISTGDTQDSLENAVRKIREKCSSHVNLSMAMFNLVHAKQRTRTFTEFASQINDLATHCQLDTHPYDKDRAMKDALIFGTSDEKLRQEALAKDFSLTDIHRSALGYEQSRQSAGAIKQERGQSTEDCRKVYSQHDVDEIVAKVTAGRYSTQHKPDNKSRLGAKSKKGSSHQ